MRGRSGGMRQEARRRAGTGGGESARVGWCGAVLVGLVAASGCSGGDDIATTDTSSATDVTGESLNPSGVGDGVGSAIFFCDARPRHTGWEQAGGWTITYERVLLALGDVQAPSVTGAGGGVASSSLYVVDAVATPRVQLFEQGDIAVGMYGPLAYTVEAPVGSTPALAPVRPAERDAMSQEGVSVVIEGSIEDPAGVACTPGMQGACEPAPKVSFRWRLPVGVLLSKCEGFEVARSEKTEVDLRVAVDAWFRTGFTAVAAYEPRAAQWVADADLDRDGETTVEELKQVAASDLFGKEQGYDLEGAPIPITTAYDYLMAQAMMMGVVESNCAGAPLEG